MKKLILLIFLILSLNSFSVELSLKELIDLSLKNASELKKSDLNNENKKLDLEKSKDDLLPSLNWSSSYSKDENNENYRNSISLSQSLYKGGKIKASIEKSKLNLEYSQYENEILKKDIYMKNLSLFTSAIKYKNQIEVYNSSKISLEKEYDKLKVLFEKKMISKTELLKIQNNILSLKSRILDSEISYKNIINELKENLNLKDDIEIKSPEINFEFNLILDNDLNKALSESNEIKKSNLNILIAEEDKKITKSSYFPELSLSFSYSDGDKDISKSFDEPDWNIGLSFKYNLFDWGNRKDSLKQEENNILMKKYDKELIKKEIKVNLKNKYTELEKYVNQIKFQEEESKILKEIFDIDKVKFDNKFIEVSDFLDSENNYTESLINLGNLKLDYFLNLEEYKNMIN